MGLTTNNLSRRLPNHHIGFISTRFAGRMVSHSKQKNGRLYWNGSGINVFILQANVTARQRRVRLCLRRSICIPILPPSIRTPIPAAGQ